MYAKVTSLGVTGLAGDIVQVGQVVGEVPFLARVPPHSSTAMLAPCPK